MTTPTVVPMDHDTAERIATMACKPGARTMVGPGVLAGLLDRIHVQDAELQMLRRALDRYRVHELEAARLRAHALMVQQTGADR
jgi:hypothetical protein